MFWHYIIVSIAVAFFQAHDLGDVSIEYLISSCQNGNKLFDCEGCFKKNVNHFNDKNT